MQNFQSIIDDVKVDYPDFDFLLDIRNLSNGKKLSKDIDPRDIKYISSCVGVTVCYPNKESATHVIIMQEDSNISAQKFKQKIEGICQSLKKKANLE